MFKVGDMVTIAKDDSIDGERFKIGDKHEVRLARMWSGGCVKINGVHVNDKQPEYLLDNGWWVPHEILVDGNYYGCRSRCKECKGRCALWEAE
jgi:hypothetical protein